MSTETLPIPPDAAPVAEAALPRVVILADSRFFVRSVPVNASGSAEDVATQVELALETLSPFPVNQLYHGHLWKPGSAHALAYAAYRRRFTPEETEFWSSADLVIPTFVTAFGYPIATGGTVLFTGPDFVTAVHWGDAGGVPSRVLTEPLAVDASPEERSQVREAVLRALGGTNTLVELDAPAYLPGDLESPVQAFTASGKTLSVSVADSSALDVRDKAELAARRRAKARDLALWRCFIGLLALLLFALVGEGGLIGLRAWGRSRQATLDARQPKVDRIMAQQTLATRIEELSTKRLRPFEMITMVHVESATGTKKPDSIQFLRTTTSGLNVLQIEAQTRIGGDLALYQAALRQNPAIASIEVTKQELRDATTSFTLVVTFKPEALMPAAAP
ncbi:MAG: hypothetical protein JNN01_20275 [Opitutaceae bacterium]|nr:hypothetical protein [Opitutaceae bacterium]